MDTLEDFKEDFRKHQKNVLAFLTQAEAHATSSQNESLLAFVTFEKKKVLDSLNMLQARSESLFPRFETELESRTKELEKQIADLERSKEVLRSDNLLLQYKRKDLLQLATNLEEANENILSKNEELLKQQQTITQQSAQLQSIHEEILGKHDELERQKEALQDQSDYLHEANQTITLMHEEVQKQKNEILQKNEELLNLNNEKNNLIGIVAHDLKSPLNQMKGLLTIIKLNSAGMNEESQACIEMMEKSAERLTTLIGKILDVEAIESKTLNLVNERINISELLESMANRYTSTAAQKDISIHQDIHEHVFILADKIYVTQIIDNLLSNAVKFSPKEKRVFVNLSIVKDEARIEIKDEGPGISEEDKKKLFGKYQRLSARPTANESSTGLGLSIVKKFVEAMHGRIWCESLPEKGASFFVSFPLS